jgi:hypothetical protein
MSFRFACSADPIPNGSEANFYGGVVGGVSTVADTDFGSGSRRAHAATTSASEYAQVGLANHGGAIVDPAVVYFQIRVKATTSTVPGEGRCLFQVGDGSTVHVSIVLNTDWTISAWRGTTVAGLLGSASTYVIPNGFNSAVHTLRGKIRIHDSSGTVELRMDGDDATPILNLSSQDTRNGVNGQVTFCNFLGSATGTLDVHWSDAAIWSDEGSDGWTGWKLPLSFKYYAAASDVAGSVAWTPSTGSNHAALVDEATLVTTDYNASATVNQEDKLETADVATPVGTIHAVLPMVVAATPDAGGNALAIGLDISGTSVYGGNLTMTGTATMYQHSQNTKPGGGSWAASDQANVRICYKVAT